MNNSGSADGGDAGALAVSLAIGVPERRVRFEGVIDRDFFGEAVGLEILGLRLQLGDVDLPEARGDALPRWAYDEEMDALYVRLRADTASIQASVCGTASVDKAGRLLSLELTHSPEQP